MTDDLLTDDHRLLEAYCTSGSQSAFSAIMQRYRPLVVGIGLRVLGDLHHAEDAAQATFIALAQKAPTLRMERSLAGWLYVAALTSARELRRALQRRRHYEQAAGRELRGSAAPPPDHTAVTLALDDLLASLPTEQREALILRYIQGLSEAEAAALLDCPVRTLHNRVARGLARLRERLRLDADGDLARSLPALLVGLGRLPPAGGVPVGLTHVALQAAPHASGAGLGMKVGVAAAIIAAIGLPVLVVQALHARPRPPAATALTPTATAHETAAATPAAPAAELTHWRASIGGPWGISGMALGQDGRLWSCGYDRLLQSWDTTTGVATSRLTIPGDGMRGLSLSPDQRTLALAASNQTVVLHDLATGTEHTLAGHRQDVTAVAFTPDGATLVSGSKDGTGILWDVASGTRRALLAQQRDHVWGVAASPAGQSVALVGDDHAFWTYDVRSGAPLVRFSGFRGVLRSVVYVADGTLLLTGGDESIRLWDPRDGRCLGQLDDQVALINALALSADGAWLASGSSDGRIVIWDLATRRVLARAQGEPGGADCLCFTPDRRLLISAGSAALRVWSLGAAQP